VQESSTSITAAGSTGLAVLGFSAIAVIASIQQGTPVEDASGSTDAATTNPGPKGAPVAPK